MVGTLTPIKKLTKTYLPTGRAYTEASHKGPRRHITPQKLPNDHQLRAPGESHRKATGRRRQTQTSSGGGLVSGTNPPPDDDVQSPLGGIQLGPEGQLRDAGYAFGEETFAALGFSDPRAVQ